MLDDTNAALLQLNVLPDAAAPVAHICVQELDALAAQLARWGRFRAPVNVATTDDRAALRIAANAPSSTLLCALATTDLVTVLNPRLWASPPSHNELYRTLLHELMHVLTFQRCVVDLTGPTPALPVWFREGSASFVAEGAPAANERRVVAGWPMLERLASAGAYELAERGDECYAVARVVFASWLELHGDRGWAALCRAMRSGLPFESAHQRACGVPAAEFVRRWVAQVRAEAATG